MSIRTAVILIGFFFSWPALSSAQQLHYDTLHEGRVIVEKDARIDALAIKVKEYNDDLSRQPRQENGFRLMLLSTSDRNKVTQLRTRLLQLYPDQKLYTLFKSPYIKVKFGNFLEREEAERMRDEILAKGLVEGNIYIVPEKIELSADKGAESPEASGPKD
jgi:hypothetical protein